MISYKLTFAFITVANSRLQFVMENDFRNSCIVDETFNSHPFQHSFIVNTLVPLILFYLKYANSNVALIPPSNPGLVLRDINQSK